MVDTSKTPVTIVGLRAENFKKIVLVEVATDAAVVTVGGLNEAGKSSVLDAVATVLGGADLAPRVPIRKGQTKSTVVATLTDGLKITRTFKRVPASEDAPERVVSTLEIANADGSATFKSPQAMLDKLLGGGAFHDPLAFSDLRPAERREAVRRIVGLDFTVQDARRRQLLDDRLHTKRRLESSERAIEGVAPYTDVPVETIDPADVLKEIEAADQTQEAANEALSARRRAEQHLLDNDTDIATADSAVAFAEKALRAAQARAASVRADRVKLEGELVMRDEVLTRADAAVVDAEPLRARMRELAAVNKKVAHNLGLVATESLIDALRGELEVVNRAIATIDDEKREALEAAPFPVAGMSFSEDDVLLDGLPFAQASTARRLRVSVAMALARAGQLRVLLVKAGNDLDTKNLGLLAEVAREHGAQVWVERVTDDPASVSVFIEDGSGRS